MNDKFLQLLTERYAVMKSQFPLEGRRRWHLRVLQEFWSNGFQSQHVVSASDTKLLADQFAEDDDPMDQFLEGQELGILLRTDYTDEDAWKLFCKQLEEAEKEFADGMKLDESEAKVGEPSSGQDINMADASAGSDSDSEHSTDGIPSPIIKIINLISTEYRAIFNNISNLTALRLFNDVDIRPALSPPSGEKRINPPNRLIDQGGWQEIYSGMNIWIYDSMSNTDQCVRLVGQEGGDIYGTASGDSWRARGTHICELQFNMSYLGMKIDFGGLDRWDYHERRRNMDEAIQPIS